MPRPGASAAVFRGPQVLLVERAKAPFAGKWSLPGGDIEPGESAREAARRELAEETGIDAELVGLADVAEVIIRDGGKLVAHHVIAVFYGRWLSGEARAGSDAAAVRWVPLEELGALALTEGTQAIIERAAAELESQA